METKEILKMLLEEDAYVQDVSVEMNLDGFTDMTVRFRIIPSLDTGVPRVVLMGRKQHDKIEKFLEPLEDELFKM